jgi:hypothetical protein
MIRCKDAKVFRRLMANEYHRTLIWMAWEMCVVFPVMVCTEAWREALHPGDVHFYGRGLDWREWHLKDPQFVVDFVNGQWQYDYKRPDKRCLIRHKNHNAPGYHFHMQTHPNTVRLVDYKPSEVGNHVSVFSPKDLLK